MGYYGADLGTQTKASLKVELGMAECIPNETLARRIFQSPQSMRLDGRKYQAVQNMDLTELLSIGPRCQKGMSDEYVSGTEIK